MHLQLRPARSCSNFVSQNVLASIATCINKPSNWEGVNIPSSPGKSLVSAFPEDKAIKRSHLWWLHDGHRAVRQGDFKLVSAKNEPWELYDLKTDRAESKNLVEEKPKLKQKLETIWNDEVEAFKKMLH